MHVVATAGHVDHGKSTLVRALTGMEPDRWAEERRRGMTIDLGFAWTDLPSGRTVAFVDVPGHARFVGNMLAGVGPVPVVLFVVAADGGWQPQSEEHLAAIDALGVSSGLLAVTRSDLADPGPATAAALDRIATSSLGRVTAVAVSGVRGDGLERLRAALDRLLSALPAADPAAPVRFWIDRVFSVKGSGTVVTGTLGAGTLRVGEQLLAVGAGRRPVRVRALQTLERSVEEARAVARVAVNLRGAQVGDLGRGDALLSPGRWPLPSVVDVALPEGAAGGLPAELTLHAGSAAVRVQLRPLGTRAARLRLDRPLPLRPGDRALLRDPGGTRVPVGLTVLDVEPPALRRRGAAARRAVELPDRCDPPDPAGEVRRRGAVRRASLATWGLLEPDAAPPAGIVAVGGWLVAPQLWQSWVQRLAAAVAAHAASSPLAGGLPAAAAGRAAGLPDPALLPPLVTEAGLVAESGRVGRPDARAVLPPAVEELRARLRTDPFAAAEAAELTERGLAAPVLAAAVRAGRLAQFGPGIYLLPDAAEVAVRRLATLAQPFTLSAARQALGTTRRVAVPLLEELDRRGATRRVDGVRRELRAGSGGGRPA